MLPLDALVDGDTLKALGNGNAQMVMAFCLLLTVGLSIWLGRTLFTTLKDQIKEGKDDTGVLIASNNNVAQALRDIRTSVETMAKMIDRLLDMREKA